MTEIGNIIRMILSSFSLQLLLAELIFSMSLEKRKAFWSKLAISGALFIGLTYDLPFFTFGSPISFRFIFTFLLSLGILFLCFRAKPMEIIFCGVAGYALRTFAQNAFLLLKYVLSLEADSSKSWIYYLVYLVLYPILGFVFARKLYNGNADSSTKSNGKVITVSAIVLFTNELMCYSIWVLCVPDNPVFPVYGMMCSTLALALLTQIFIEKDLTGKNALLQQLLLKEQEKYDLAKQNADLLNQKAHDLKHQIAMIRENAPSASVEHYLTEMDSVVSDFDDMPNTGCAALDIVLREKLMQCAANGIEFTYMAQGALLSHMEEPDIYALLGNILSNAIEAELQEEKRFISLILANRANQVYLHVDNCCTKSIVFADGYPQTENDPSFHGFGTRSIHYTVEKHGGMVEFSVQNQRFCVDALLPMPKAASLP